MPSFSITTSRSSRSISSVSRLARSRIRPNCRLLPQSTTFLHSQSRGSIHLVSTHDGLLLRQIMQGKTPRLYSTASSRPMDVEAGPSAAAVAAHFRSLCSITSTPAYNVRFWGHPSEHMPVGRRCSFVPSCSGSSTNSYSLSHRWCASS